MRNIKEWLIQWLHLGYYTSKIDEFLSEFAKNHPKWSASKCQEKEKYARIFALRDNPTKPRQQKDFWDKF